MSTWSPFKARRARPCGYLAIALFVSLGCGDEADDGLTAPAGGAASTSAGGSGGGAQSGGSGGTSGGHTGVGGGTGGGGVAEPAPKVEFIPTPTGTCPEFAGDEITFYPDGIERIVKLWIGEEAQTLDGPLLFSWHGWYGSPGAYIIDDESRAALLAMGGLMVAPYVDPADEDEYWDVDDLRLADEVLACAIEKVGVDLRHVHTAGLSAGGRQSLLLAYQRSGYIASFVSYSPGVNEGSLTTQDPENLFPGIITHGADSEDPIYQELAEGYFDGLTAAGHFVVMCVHDQGHSTPSLVQPETLGFFLDHPFGIQPPPYTNGLPSTYPSYCRLTK